MFCLVLLYFYRTSRRDPGALFELRRWAAILPPTLQFDNTSAPGPSEFADPVSVSPTIAEKPCDDWECAFTQSPGSFKDYKLRKRRKKKSKKAAHDSCVYLKI